jgi:ABC-type Fe3+ transport system substrate-binding protein
MADGPKLTPLGKFFVFVFIAACLAAAFYRFGGEAGRRLPFSKPPAADSTAPGGTHPSASVQIGIAYGTEKKRWMEWAANEFAQTREGRDIGVNLIPMGSLDGAHAILNGDKRINVWSPASALYKDTFAQEWQVKVGGNPIVREEPLALTPMVFVFWDERYQQFAAKYGKVSLATIADAEQQKGGWEAIANKPEWGFFKFGHTQPNTSASGLMTLVLAAYSYSNKSRDLTLKDIVNVGFQEWLEKLERGVAGMSDSTGNMMREMVLKGPSSFDALFVYESVALDYLKNAEGRWGQLRVVYPEYNMWSDSPYYILDTSWSSQDQRKAAQTFLDFLLTERIQKECLMHGFRPANTNVAVKFAGSPFVDFARYGVQDALGKICDLPKAEVTNNLLTSWQRTQSGR